MGWLRRPHGHPQPSRLPRLQLCSPPSQDARRVFKKVKPVGLGSDRTARGKPQLRGPCLLGQCSSRPPWRPPYLRPTPQRWLPARRGQQDGRPHVAAPGPSLAGPMDRLSQPEQAVAAHGQADCTAAATTRCFLPHFLPALRGWWREAGPVRPALIVSSSLAGLQARSRLATVQQTPPPPPPPALRWRPGNTQAPAPAPRIGEVHQPPGPWPHQPQLFSVPLPPAACTCTRAHTHTTFTQHSHVHTTLIHDTHVYTCHRHARVHTPIPISHTYTYMHTRTHDTLTCTLARVHNTHTGHAYVHTRYAHTRKLTHNT